MASASLRILVFSYFTPILNVCDGGAQRLLDGLLRSLCAEDSVEAITICSPSPGSRTPLSLPKLSYVFLGDGPDGPPTSAATLYGERSRMMRAAAACDVVISVDRPFPIRVDIPVVLCLNSLGYGPELLAAFSETWDAAVVPSTFLGEELTRWLGAWAWQEAAPAVHVIAPGIAFADAAVGAITSKTPPAPGTLRLCFPHRADPSKGFDTAVRALRLLLDKGISCTLSVPEPHPDALWPHQKAHLRERTTLVSALGVQSAVRADPWIGAAEMGSYLAQFDACLALSTLPESFGLIVLESLAVGTPVIATRAGAYPELVPKCAAVQFVPFDGPAEVAEACTRLPTDIDVTRNAVLRKFSWGAATASWLQVLSETTKIEARCQYPELAEPN